MRQAPHSPEEDADGEDSRPSKSAKKRHMHSLQELGEELTELPHWNCQNHCATHWPNSAAPARTKAGAARCS